MESSVTTIPAVESPAAARLSSAASPTTPHPRNLDFIIIGSPKCGTTALHKYLQTHPQLYMLPEKEVPYFTNPDFCAKGWEWYLNEYFFEAPPEKLWGKSTPQYMSRLDVPEAIHCQMPDVKLIAILRNPIDCPFSYYKMMIKRGTETRPFSAVLNDILLAGPSQTRARQNIVIGEYTGILEAYLKVFRREQLLILFTEDLRDEPSATLRQIFRFLEVDETFVPPNLGTHYHVGGTRRWIPIDTPVLARHYLFRRFLKCLPRRIRHPFERRFLFWFTIWNTRRAKAGEQMSEEARKSLALFFHDDVRRLKKLLHIRPPWPEFADA